VPKPREPPRALIENDSQHNFSHHLKKVDETWWKINWSLGVIVRQTYPDDDDDDDDDDNDYVVVMMLI